MEIKWGLVFFFQAEDGIRDDLVTRVQTCALPIYWPPCLLSQGGTGANGVSSGAGAYATMLATEYGARSEERRVGIECRCGWARRTGKKKRCECLAWWARRSIRKRGFDTTAAAVAE